MCSVPTYGPIHSILRHKHVTHVLYKLNNFNRDLSLESSDIIKPCRYGQPVYIVKRWGIPTTGSRLNIKTVFSRYGIPLLKIRQLWDCFNFNMGIPISLRQYPYIAKVPCVPAMSQPCLFRVLGMDWFYPAGANIRLSQCLWSNPEGYG